MLRREGVMDWATKPQPVGNSRWRYPLPSELPESDLISLGGDLEPSTVIGAYRCGLFPMEASQRPGELAWWSPDPRGILPLDSLRVTRSMRQSAKRYEIRVDTCFERVIHACAEMPRENGWISEAVITAYMKLHELGWAHSVEAFDRGGQLAGGLYGVRVDRLFVGESMFHYMRDASKVALMTLVDLMRTTGMTLLDAQWCTDHLASLGGVAVSREDYFARLVDAVDAVEPALLDSGVSAVYGSREDV
jgi:leucyl/phenylalanyl-tRNA--protein transferase